MSEDNKHIEIFKEEVKKEQSEYANVNEYTKFFYNNHKIILNIIDKLQKENDTLKTTINKQSKDISNQLKELDKKDKVIDLAVEIIDNYENQLNICNFRDKEHIKEFLFEQVEEENE